MKNKKINFIVTLAFILAGLAISFITGREYYLFANDDQTFIVGDQVTRIEKFSDYSPNLKGTAGDADIFVLEGSISKEGPSLLIIGGTHPNEPAGQLTSVLFLENLEVEYGTVYIITEANRSAYTHSFPQDGAVLYYHIETPTGTRTFKFGSRATNTNEQWPNPDIYVHPFSGQKLSNLDTRNLNRSFPGRLNGSYTEQVAYAITQLILENDITITIDLHEASPEYLTNNAIVAHPGDAMMIAGNAFLNLQMLGMDIKVDESPANLRGLTHRELGLYTNTLAFLCETSNASQGKLRGKFTEELILTGEDKFYQYADELGLLYATPVSIDERVARHTESILQIITSYNFIKNRNNEPLKSLIIKNMPGYQDILDNGIGQYLK